MKLKILAANTTLCVLIIIKPKISASQKTTTQQEHIVTYYTKLHATDGTLYFSYDTIKILKDKHTSHITQFNDYDCNKCFKISPLTSNLYTRWSQKSEASAYFCLYLLNALAKSDNFCQILSAVYNEYCTE